MKQHKWAKEIHAWADGAEIERGLGGQNWRIDKWPDWNRQDDVEFRIKPQPKPDVYLYVYKGFDKTIFGNQKEIGIICNVGDKMVTIPYVGKIKLEQEE